MTIRAAIVGASGTAGAELARVLSTHPEIEPAILAAHSSAHMRMGQCHPHLHRLADVELVPVDPAQLAGCDVVFLALPHGKSAAVVSQITQANPDVLIVDCGADYRLRDADEYQRYYGGTHAGCFTYGMPELLHEGEARPRAQRAELRATRRIAVPGCNVTAVTLAAAPLVTAGLIDARRLVATLAVGYSGAGKALKPHLAALAALGNAQPYAIGGTHRHIPEIIQNLSIAGGRGVEVTFTPVLVPMNRGILATVVAPTNAFEDSLLEAYSAYADERLIDVSANGVPTTAAVAGTARVLIRVAHDERAGTAVVVAAIDNLGKGTACAAVQSANIALGLDEYAGLPMEAVS